MSRDPHVFWRCEKCIEEGLYNGLLHFPNFVKPPSCRNHKVDDKIVPVPMVKIEVPR